MFGSIGFGEMIVVLVVALIVIGPQKLPEIARTLGKGLAEFRKATMDIRANLTGDLDDGHPHQWASRPPPSRPVSAPRIDLPDSPTDNPPVIESRTVAPLADRNAPVNTIARATSPDSIPSDAADAVPVDSSATHPPANTAPTVLSTPSATE